MLIRDNPGIAQLVERKAVISATFRPLVRIRLPGAFLNHDEGRLFLCERVRAGCKEEQGYKRDFCVLFS